MKPVHLRDVMRVIKLCAIAVAVIHTMCLGSATLAQQASGPVPLGELFVDEESVDLTPEGARKFRDAAQRARGQGECPRALVTVVVKKGDKIFQTSIAQARRDALLQTLGDQARYCRFATRTDGTRNDVLIDYNATLDVENPRLRVTWTPAPGTKVKEGDRITAKVEARDDANLWQSGIKTIDLLVEGGGSFGFSDFPRPPLTCKEPPPPEQSDGVYTVPANPPPVVRLGALAQDFIGNGKSLWADFPTEPSKEPKPDTPFPPRAGCKDVRRTITHYQGIGGKCSGTMFICGESFPAGCNPQWFRRPNAVAGSEKGAQVCCDDWRKARKSKEPCDVALDADCDGIPNNRDRAPSNIGNEPPPQPKESDGFFQP